MLAAINGHRNGEFARTRAQLGQFLALATLFHELNSLAWFQGSNENEARLAVGRFHKDIGQPIHAIVEVNIGRARRMLGNEGALFFRKKVWQASSLSAE